MHNVCARYVAVFFDEDLNIDILHPPCPARELRRDLRPDLVNRLRSMLLRSCVPGPLQRVNLCQALLQRRPYRVNRNLAFHMSGRLSMTEFLFGERVGLATRCGSGACGARTGTGIFSSATSERATFPPAGAISGTARRSRLSRSSTTGTGAALCGLRYGRFSSGKSGELAFTAAGEISFTPNGACAGHARTIASVALAMVHAVQKSLAACLWPGNAGARGVPEAIGAGGASTTSSAEGSSSEVTILPAECSEGTFSGKLAASLSSPATRIPIFAAGASSGAGLINRNTGDSQSSVAPKISRSWSSNSKSGRRCGCESSPPVALRHARFAFAPALPSATLYPNRTTAMRGHTHGRNPLLRSLRSLRQSGLDSPDRGHSFPTESHRFQDRVWEPI